MAEQTTSYPSPSAAATRSGAPFYPVNAMSPPADLPELNLHSTTDQGDREEQALDQQFHDQLSRHINPELHNVQDQHQYQQDPNLMQVDDKSNPDPQSLAQEVINLNTQQDPNQLDPNQLQQQFTPSHSQTPTQIHEPPTTPGATTVAGKPRSKVSRACDECRRKKIRCDSTVDLETCSACDKNQIYCKFSRTPQKRGPSRGYIRDLAERVSSLEGQLRHDAVLGDGSGLTTEDQLQFLGLRQEPSTTAITSTKRARDSADVEDHFNHDRNGTAPHLETSEPPEQIAKLDDQLIDTYYTSVHPVLPIFHNDPSAFREYLTGIPNATRTALVMSTSAALKTAVYSGMLDVNPISDNSYDVLIGSQQADRSSLARVQAFIMLALGADNNGNELFRNGEITGTDPGTYIDQAISIAQRLHIFDLAGLLPLENDQQYALPRALALNLGILDTLNTFATKDFNANISPLHYDVTHRDIKVFGHRIYWLKKFSAELCDLQAVEIETGEEQGYMLSKPKFARSRISETNVDELIRTRGLFVKLMTAYADVATMTDLIVALAFWYTRIIIDLHFYPILERDWLLYSCRRISDLVSQLPMTNPLLHHFAGLAAHVLIQLSDIRETRTASLEILEVLDKALHGLVPIQVDSFSCIALVREAVASKISSFAGMRDSGGSLGLEHLANAAVGSSDNIDPADGGVAAAAEAAAKAAMGMGAPPVKEAQDWDPAGFSREGYLLALSR